jgi:hypothetical protein
MHISDAGRGYSVEAIEKEVADCHSNETTMEKISFGICHGVYQSRSIPSIMKTTYGGPLTFCPRHPNFPNRRLRAGIAIQDGLVRRPEECLKPRVFRQADQV